MYFYIKEKADEQTMTSKELVEQTEAKKIGVTTPFLPQFMYRL